jgi:hypothetical protein
MGNQIYFKIAGYVDLDVLIIFILAQYKFHSNLRDKMKKKSWPTTSNYIEVTCNLYCAPGALWQTLQN